jgi:YVTN family beta-propeller protein
VKDIPVGESPEDIKSLQPLLTTYVANFDPGGVSVINRETNEVVAGVTFGVSPFGGGDIICNTDDSTESKDLDAPVNRYLYVSSGTKCIAKPSKGFEFSSWSENLGGNSTRTITATSGSPWTAFLDAINLKPDDPAATLTVNGFGNFTAYFRALPPAIPSEYLIPLYGIVISTVVGLSIPSIITWRKSKKQTSRLNSYHREMTALYDDGKLDENDTEHLNIINKNIINAYSEGKINNEQYTNLKNEISVLYEKLYKKRIDILKESSDGDLNRTIQMDNIKEDIRNTYSEGKISELHYNLLNERITKITSKS